MLGRIAVIVVNYGTADLAMAAVDSVLARNHGGRDVTVHLLDNASPSGDAAAFSTAHERRGWGDRVVLYLESRNHGFGRANNLVAERLAATGEAPDAVLLLNPDAQLENEAVDILAAAMEADPGCGFAGAGIAKPDGTPVTAAFRFPSAIAEFSRALNFGPVARACARWRVALSPDHPPGRVDWVAGASLMIRAETWAATGGFDPAFFLYFEEVELMHRGAGLGWHCLYVPQAQVIHTEGAATGVRSGRPVARRHPPYRYWSWQHYFRKTHGRAGALLAAGALMAGAAGNHLLARLRRQNVYVPAHFFGDFHTHALRPLLGRGEYAKDRGPESDPS